MQTQRLIPHVVLAAVLVLAIAAAALTTSGRLDPRMPIRQDLPDRLGEFEGTDVIHCQNRHCLKSFTGEEAADAAACHTCGSAVDSVSLAERELLPKDTLITRRVYAAPSGTRLHVSIVVGGYERRSIHKPQVCLVAQGNSITRQYRTEVPLADRAPMDVMLMEMNASRMLFAYWFTDGDKETASHLVRLLSIARDGIVYNKRRRWAYVAVSAASDSQRGNIDELKDFLRKLHAHCSRD